MATFWEKAAHSAIHMLSLSCPLMILVIFHLGCKGGNLVLIVPVPGHCFSNFL